MSKTIRVINKMLHEKYPLTTKTRKLQPKRFESSQLVVCVDDKWEDISGNDWSLDSLSNYPRADFVYTVAGGFVSKGEPWLTIEEMDAANSWSADCFRPVQKKTSIDVFLALKGKSTEKTRQNMSALKD